MFFSSNCVCQLVGAAFPFLYAVSMSIWKLVSIVQATFCSVASRVYTHVIEEFYSECELLIVYIYMKLKVS